MKRWQCSVCGYIHEGDNPPEKCPVCGAPKEKFVLLDPSEYVTQDAGDQSQTIYETDVLVVGSGAAGLSAAITARNEGSDVIILEKGEQVGGTTIRSGGGFWTPNNRFQRENGIEDDKQDCLRYMARYSFPNLYDPNAERLGLPENEYALIEAYYDNASKSVQYLEDCGAVKTINEINWTGKMQVDYRDHLTENKGIRGRVLYSQNPDGEKSYGVELIRQLKEWAEKNEIKILLEHEATEIIQNIDGEVIGLKAITNGEVTKYFRARKAVIFGSGGYSHNSELMLHFQRGPHYGGCSAPTNTGDFIKMASQIGVKIGNMAGAFRAESIFESVLENPGGSNNVFYIPGDSVIEVNRYGKRIMDEKRNYTDRTMLHFVWDPQRAEWTNMLVFMIWDERTANLWQGFPPYPQVSEIEDTPYLIKGDTWDELSVNIKDRLSVLSKHTGAFDIAPEFADNLKKTVERFNQFASSGIDEDFSRGAFAYDREWTTFPPTVPNTDWPDKNSLNYTMYPLSDHGPYYAVILSAGTLDTNGGPIINAKAEVLNSDGKAIVGLYGAGNCIASPTANAYWGAGSTIGPALTFGHVAGMQASAKKARWA